MASTLAEAPGKDAIPCKQRPTVLRLEHAEADSLPKDPFLIYKSVHKIVGDIESAHSENGGVRYTFKVNKPEQVEALLQMKQLNDGTPVIVTERSDNNVTRCVVKSRELMHSTEEELLEEVASQGVISVRKITRKCEEGLQEETPSIVLYFSGHTTPEYVDFAGFRVKTSPYYPELIQCYNCWQFWHIKPNCTCEPICGTCSGPHETVKGKVCEAKPFCKKCESDDHSISSRKCPIYLTENTIARIRIDRNISYDAAKKAYEDDKGKSVDVLMKKIADLELMLKNEKTSRSVKNLVQKLTDMELIIKKKDHEIQVLRGIFNALNRIETPPQNVVPPKSQTKKKVPSKTVANQPKAETKPKPMETSVNDQHCCSTGEDSKPAGKSAARAGKKKRGKAKK